MLRKLDDWLNSMTMYKLVLYGLGVLAGVTLLLSATGTLSYPLGRLLGSLLLLVSVSYVVNIGLGKLYHLPVNLESSVITGLILFFIILPPIDRAGWLALVVAAVAAMASKYVFTWRHASIFNPAAAGALVVSLAKLGSAGWWVASRPLFIFTLLIGLLIIRKVRRFSLFFCFLIPAVLLNIYWLMHSGSGASDALQTAVMSYPVIFLGAFMLTEPSSMPQTNHKRLIFGLLVGVLFASRIKVGDVSVSPHLALILGNLFAFFVSTRVAARLKLIKRTELAPNIYDFAFQPDQKLHFEAGQYMEWTLPNVKLDSRGNRRIFTIASSPREEMIHVGFKKYEPSSQFKNTLMTIKEGDYIEASHVAGDFVMPSTNQQLVFIAGGIGVTPFRSMIADMVAKKQSRNIVLFYLAPTDAEVVYKNVWAAAAPLGVTLVPLTNKTRLTPEILAEKVPNYKKSLYYISGPPPMVYAYKAMLKMQGVAASRIHSDYFSGY